ncbi:MAG: hypothetical protein L0216_14740 [Planctomycetales bacterium]|nr:hypothetical protein [Planctomycetales bacterium]
MLVAVSSAIVALLLIGVSLRRSPKRHVPVMLATIVSDLALVGWIEISARAVEKAASGTLHWGIYVHIGIATLCILGYVLAIVTGTKLLRDPASPVRRIHRANAIAVVLLRLSVLATTPGFLIVPAIPGSAS